MGAALAMAFHHAGLDVVATARDVKKIHSLQRAGIRTLSLDILSAAFINECINQLSSLDFLKAIHRCMCTVAKVRGMLPAGLMNRIVKQIFGMNEVERALRQGESCKVWLLLL